VVDGRVTGISDGIITGWIAAEAPDAAFLEAAADGEPPFGRTLAEPGQDGRLHFAIPIPGAYRDGRMRFFDVRLLGEGRPLAGGPVIFDGGLFAPAEPAEQAPAAGEAPELIEGLVRFEPPGRIEGWAWAPAEPGRRLQLEIIAGDRLIAVISADKPLAELKAEGVGDGRYGFVVELSRLLRRGPHEVIVRAVGTGAPLPGGRFRTGVFAPDGEVDCPGYLDDEQSRGRLERLAFEHQAWDALRMDPERLAPRLINRLRRERLAHAGAPPAALLLTLPGAPTDAAALWALQSYPNTALTGAAEGAAEVRRTALSAGRVFFLGAAEVLHPSAAAIAARADEDVVSWGRFCADEPRAGSPGWALRRPAFDPITARHGALTGTTLALKGEVLARAPDEVLAPLLAGRLHPLWFWLAGQDLTWSAHPEALTSSVGPSPPLDRAEVLEDEAMLRRMLDAEGGAFALERTDEEAPFPLVLVPSRRAAKVSVLLPFRGRPELTLRCVLALAGQRLSGEMELILIDNQSEPEEAAVIVAGARRLLGEARVKSLCYDAPFNHSAQNNLAVRAAEGEVVVLCNNDVALKDPTALEQLAAWALQPGVGAVGCRLEDAERRVGSYGHVFTAPSPDPFQPPLRENPDPSYGGFVHACPGATLALAAIRRELYLELGGLDEARFPIGYNDIDFMLRASARGLRHLYLGHVAAEHRRGSSRTGDDEDLLALQINQAFAPAIAEGRLHQLMRVRIGAQPQPERPTAGPPTGAAEVKEIAGLQKALESQRSREQRRAELADALWRAKELAARLEQELGATDLPQISARPRESGDAGVLSKGSVAQGKMKKPGSPPSRG
jgi:GT2 family glycosyltransferase